MLEPYGCEAGCTIRQKTDHAIHKCGGHWPVVCVLLALRTHMSQPHPSSVPAYAILPTNRMRILNDGWTDGWMHTLIEKAVHVIVHWLFKALPTL